MEVLLVKACPLGAAGAKVSDPSAWRLCFPVKGCVAKPADLAAVQAVQSDLDTLKGQSLDRALGVMAAAGVWPVELPAPAAPREERPPVKTAAGPKFGPGKFPASEPKQATVEAPENEPKVALETK